MRARELCAPSRRAEYDANKARGLDGALQKVAAAPYGEWLLGAVAAGLFAYGGHLRRTVLVLVQEVLLEPVGR